MTSNWPFETKPSSTKLPQRVVLQESSQSGAVQPSRQHKENGLARRRKLRGAEPFEVGGGVRVPFAGEPSATAGKGTGTEPIAPNQRQPYTLRLGASPLFLTIRE